MAVPRALYSTREPSMMPTQGPMASLTAVPTFPPMARQSVAPYATQSLFAPAGGPLAVPAMIGRQPVPSNVPFPAGQQQFMPVLTPYSRPVVFPRSPISFQQQAASSSMPMASFPAGRAGMPSPLCSSMMNPSPQGSSRAPSVIRPF